MPLGAARLNFLAKSITVAPVVAEVIRKKRNFFAVGNAQIDTAQSKFGGTSLYLDGSDYIEHTASGLINTDNNGTVTIEMWVRPAATQAYNGLFDASPSVTGGIREYGAAGNLVAKVLQEANGASTGTWTANTWTHFAVTFDNGVIKTYRDGTLEDTGSYTGGIEDKGAFIIGAINRGGAGYFTGHIDEFRISDSIRYTSGFTPQTTPFVNDDNTRCLLHFDGTDGSTYFDDDNGVGRSPVGVTAYGNAQVDTAQSKFGGSSLLCDGTGDYIYAVQGCNLGSGDFTIELWVRWNNITGLQGVITDRPPTSAGLTVQNFYFEKTVSNAVAFGFSTAGYIQSASSAVTTGVWYHFAAVRSSGTIRAYKDGVEFGTALSGAYATIDYGDGTLSIGASTGYYLNGWVDEVRLSTSARYTSNFTAPTAPFVNDANTKLLLHMDGTDARTLFLDDNGTQGRGNQVVVTAVNQAQIDTAQYKFGSASALFDGTDDYLKIGDNSSSGTGSGIIPTTGEFTLECWVRFNTNTNYRAFITQYGYLGQGNPSGRTALYLTNGNKFAFFINGGGAITGTTSSSTGVWYHIAATRDSSNVVRLFVNGTEEGNNFTSSASIVDSYTTIGATSNSLDFDMDGHIDEMRVSNVARYTANFTAPTEPFQNDANTLMLLHMDGPDGSTTFLDDCGRQKVGVTALGNAQIDTAQSKFGGSSALFDGTGDYLTFYHNITATDDFVFEGWVRFNALPSSGGYSFLAGNSLGNNRYFAVKNEGGTYRFETGVNGTSGSFYRWWNTSLSTGTWYHWALVKNGTSLSMYQDGSALSITGSSGSMTQDKHLFNGGNGLIATWAALSQNFNGWMDEVRISNTARYTSGFTPSTTPFQNDANTVLLLHCDGSDGGTDFVEDNGKEST